jgi:small subunit ribosomal protein S15
VKLTKSQVEELIVKLAKKGYTSARIGKVLKEQHGISSVKELLGKGIAKVMREHNVYPEIPEDLFNLLRRAVDLREHLARHRKDRHSARGLEVIESKIRRLAKYYKRKGVLPQDWTYEPEKAKLWVRA